MANSLFRNPILLLEFLLILSYSILPSSIAQNQINQSIPVTLGFIASDSTTFETGKSIAAKAIEDINKYMTENLYPYKFDVQAKDATGQANTHLEKVIQMKANGISFIVGGGWSSQAQSSLSYVNSNNLILVSTSSTSPTLAAVDNLFRLSPADSYPGSALADIMWSYGIKSVIIFQRGDSWGDGIVNLFVPAWTAKGGTIAGEKIRYASESVEFANYLQVANTQAQAAITKYGTGDKVAVLLLAFNEASVIVSQSKQYQTLYGLTWFGGEGTAKNQDLVSDAGAHVKLYSLLKAPPTSQKYGELFSQFPHSDIRLYDALWIYALSILKAGSTDTAAVKNALPSVAGNYVGAWGPYILNQYGDQANVILDIWSYGYVGNKVTNVYSGQYDLYRKQLYWGPGLKIGTSISCSPKPDSILVKGSSTISGSITPTVANAKVSLYITKPDGATATTSLTTNSVGGYSTTVTTNTAGFWGVRVAWDGNDAYYGATSQTAEIYVKRYPSDISLSIEAVPIDDYPEVSFRVSGQLTPEAAGESIKIGFAWEKGVANFTLVQTSLDGKFMTNYTPKKSGYWEIIAEWEGNSTYSPSAAVEEISVVEPSLRATVILYVKDESAKPIGGATVISLSQPSSQKSLTGVVGSNGTLNFRRLRPGAYSFQAVLDGYESSQVSVSADPGKIIEGTIILKKKAGVGVPSFPMESIAMGILIGLTSLILLRRLFSGRARSLLYDSSKRFYHTSYHQFFTFLNQTRNLQN